MDIARGLNSVHDLDIVHGGLTSVSHRSILLARSALLRRAPRLRQMCWSTRMVVYTSLASAMHTFSRVQWLGRQKVVQVLANVLVATHSS